MGFFIGLSVLIFVLYGVMGSWRKRSQEHEYSQQLVQNMSDARAKRQALEDEIEQLHQRLADMQHNAQQELQEAYRKGFQDGMAYRQPSSQNHYAK